MGIYKTLSIVQSVLLLITAWSIMDFGHSLNTINGTSLVHDLFINNLLFSSSSEFWNMIIFWGYMAFIVGILEVVKALKSNEQ